MEENLHWYALSVYRNKVFEASRQLSDACADIYVPTVKKITGTNKVVDEPAVARLMFIRTCEHTALSLEKEALEDPRRVNFFIFRNIAHDAIQPIPDAEMHMFMLVSSMGEHELSYLPFNDTDYRRGDHVRVTEGPFKGTEGYVKRIKKDRRVVVEIYGVCAVALPYIHREFLEKITD